ncbi:MAG: hypothetical protein ACUVV6_02630 [Thermoplasmatota archaeon]
MGSWRDPGGFKAGEGGVIMVSQDSGSSWFEGCMLLAGDAMMALVFWLHP